MKLAASNIGWTAEQDPAVWQLLGELGYQGLEIAPTRIFPEEPYRQLDEAIAFEQKMLLTYGLTIPSMQSIWYGQTGNLFVPEQAQELCEYTRQAIDFAYACQCGNLVFGCPRNRNIPEGHTAAEADDFFAQLGCYAVENDTVLALEANPPLYNTNFLNTTAEAFALAEKLANPGVKVNLDVGTMLANGETVDQLTGKIGLVNHVHISEPGLAPIQERTLHRELAALLRKEGYEGYVSVEMKAADPDTLRSCLTYVAEVFA